MEFVQPIREKSQIESIKMYLKGYNFRDYCLFTLGINSVNFKDKYSVNTVSRNLPIELINGEFYVTARYTNIPGSVIYFFIKLKNLQSDYVTINNTVDLKINAEIKRQECKHSKIEVLPSSKIGGLLPCG